MRPRLRFRFSSLLLTCWVNWHLPDQSVMIGCSAAGCVSVLMSILRARSHRSHLKTKQSTGYGLDSDQETIGCPGVGNWVGA